MKSKLEATHWLLSDGVSLARKIEYNILTLGAHCALGGSVLHKGLSTKDVDIFIYSHKTEEPYIRNQIIGALVRLGLEDITELDHSAYGDDKVVYKAYDRHGRRVDIFFL